MCASTTIKDINTSAESNNANNFGQEQTVMPTEKESTTLIVNEKGVVEASMNMQTSIPLGLKVTASTGMSQDLVDFLAKPYPIQSGVFQATDTSSTFPLNALLGGILSLDIYHQKIKGHLGIRCSVKLRIQFNADRFMQGRYILAFEPFVQSTTGAQTFYQGYQKDNQMRNSKTTVTQLPHVQFDLNCDTEAILEIPFVSPYSHYGINTSTGELGSWFLYPYSPLVTGSSGSSVCQYTVWTSLHDVELAGPTLPQMCRADPLALGLPFDRQMARPKGMAIKRGSIEEQEQKSIQQGPISAVLSKVSRAADIVAEIPLISNIAKPVSWAADIFMRAAHVFGFSKPLALAAPMRMKSTTIPFWGNCDQADYSLPMSLLAANTVEAMPGFAGTDVDETSIDFIKTIPAYYQQFAWTTSQTTGTNLFRQVLAPSTFLNTYNSATGGTGTIYVAMTPMAYLTHFFANYRGSIRLIFKIVKTEFHSGRLVVSYAPSQTTGSTYSIQDSTYLHREVLDIREGCEFSYVLPYASIQPYRRCNDPYGVMQIDVLNELTCPATVNSSVTILVEVSAAPDMEFSFPVGPKMTPLAPFDRQMNNARPDCEISDGVIAGAAMFNDGLAASRFCVGEKVMSLMQLIKKSSWWPDRNDDSGASTLAIVPSSISSASTTSSAVVLSGYAADLYSQIACCFALSRGSFRFKIITPDPENVYVHSNIAPIAISYSGYEVQYNVQGSFYDLNTYAFWNQPVQVFDLNNSAIEVQVPQYSRFPVRVNQEVSFYNNNWSSHATNTIPDLGLYIERGAGAFSMYRSVGDDFQLGYFTGVPPMLLNT
nr:MAG: structural polyprotein [Pseudoscorpian dicistrovirus 2]